jgi:hypothetical protein
MDEAELARQAEKRQRKVAARRERFLSADEWQHADISNRRYATMMGMSRIK